MRARHLLSVAVLCAPWIACAQSSGTYPTKPIRIIVPVAAGGNVDLVARALSQQLSEGLGQQVIVDNRPGASSLVGSQLAAKAPPDGYTLLAIANTFVVAPSIVAKPGYHPLKDFDAVTLTCLVPQVLVVTPALPVKTVKELVALAKARPGELSYASSGAGATGHMAAELLSRQVGIKMLHVPYKGNAQSIVDVIAGQVQVMFDQISTAEPHIRAGKIRPLAVTSGERSPLFPQVVTMQQAGIRDYEDITLNGLVAPAGTPRDIRVRLQTEIAKAVQVPAVRERFLQRGVELRASATPEAFAAQLKNEFEKKAKLAREANIRID